MGLSLKSMEIEEHLKKFNGFRPQIGVISEIVDKKAIANESWVSVPKLGLSLKLLKPILI